MAAVLPLALAAAVSPQLVDDALDRRALLPAPRQSWARWWSRCCIGRSTGLSPFSVVVSATFWTWLWGPIGLILSTPPHLLPPVLGRHVERLEFLDVILGDRPALTPVESFYQRMLAGDPDEAHDQAEVLLRDRPLSSYYDEVALKGLQLAANDAARGVLTEAQLEKIKVSMQDLIDDLDEHDDKDPERRTRPKALRPRLHAANKTCRDTRPRESRGRRSPAAWRGPAPVLCIAGRGPWTKPPPACCPNCCIKAA